MKNAPSVPLIAPAGKAGVSLLDIYRSHIIYMYRLISRHVSTCWLLFPFYFPSYFYFKFWIFNVKKIRIWIRLNPTWTQKRIQKNFWVRHGLKTDSKNFLNPTWTQNGFKNLLWVAHHCSVRQGLNSPFVPIVNANFESDPLLIK